VIVEQDGRGEKYLSFSQTHSKKRWADNQDLWENKRTLTSVRRFGGRLHTPWLSRQTSPS